MINEPQIQNEEKKQQPEEAVKNDEVMEKETKNESPLIKGAVEAAERLEKANEEMKKNIERAENIAAENALGGRSFGGQEIKPKEESAEEYSEKILKGEVNPLAINEK